MKKISQFFYNKTNLWIAIGFTILTFGYLYLVMIPASACFQSEMGEEVSLGTSFGFPFEVVSSYLSAMNDQQLSCFKTFNQLWDNIFAVLYGLMYVAWLSLLFKPRSSKFKAFNLLPFGQTIFDWLENFQLSGLAYNLLSDSDIKSTGVQVASIFNMTKWVFSGLVFTLIIIGIILRITRSLQYAKK